LKALSHGDTYELTMEFLHEIAVAESKWSNKGRFLQMHIEKKEAKWWDRLLKDTKKHGWLSIDWNRWKDEDDTDDEEKGDFGNDFNFGNMDLGAGGGASSMGMPDEEGESSSDEEEIPNLE